MTKKLISGAVVALILVGACTPAAAKIASPPPSSVAAPRVAAPNSQYGAPGAYRPQAPASAVTDPSAHEVPWYLKADGYAASDEMIGLRQTTSRAQQPQ